MLILTLVYVSETLDKESQSVVIGLTLSDQGAAGGHIHGWVQILMELCRFTCGCHLFVQNLGADSGLFPHCGLNGDLDR